MNGLVIWVLLVWPTAAVGEIPQPSEIAFFQDAPAERVCKALAGEIQEVTKHLSGCIRRVIPSPKTNNIKLV